MTDRVINDWDECPPQVPYPTDEDFDFAAAKARVLEQLRDHEDSIASETPERRLLNDVDLMALPDPDWLISDILPLRGVAVMVGAPGSFKTTGVAGLLLDVAIGRPWFGHTVRHPGESLYVGAEDPCGFKIRLAAAKRAAHQPLDRVVGVYTYPDGIDLRDRVNIGVFLDWMTTQRRTFQAVVIDTYAAATPGAAENSSEDTTAAMAAAQAIRDTLQATVILIHHTNAAGTRERGHTAMKGAADAMIMLEPVDDVIHVRCDKMRNGPFFETLTLKPVPVDGGGMVLRLASDVLPNAALTSLQSQVLDALCDVAGNDGASKTTWRSACSMVTERSFYKVASVLEERGHVIKRGQYFSPKVKK